MRLIFSFAFHIFLLSIVLGQDYFTTVQHYTIQNGLSDNYVVDIFQDSKGFIWIPSQTGMNRFDGHEFLSFTKESHGLTTNDFEAVLEDPLERLWFVSKGDWNTEGLSYYQKKITIYNPIDESFTPIGESFELPFEEKDMIWITNDKNNSVWISTKKGAIYKSNGTDLKLIYKKEVADNWLGRYTISSNGKIGILESEKVTIVDSTGTFLYDVQLPYDNNLIYAGLNDEIWVYNTRSHLEDRGILRVWHLDHESKSYRPFYFKQGNGTLFDISKEDIIYTAFKMDSKGRYWTFIEERFLIFNHDGILIADLTHILEEHEIPSESILYNFSKNDCVWLATEKGCFSVALRKQRFHELLYETDYGIAGSIVQDKAGNILVSQNEIIKIDSTENISGNIQLSNVSVSYEDELGDLWFADEMNGIHLYDYNSEAVETIIQPNQEIGSKREALFVRRFIRCLFHNTISNELLVGTRAGGLLKVDIQNKMVYPFLDYNEFIDLKNKVVNHFYKNDDGVWLCTSNGLYLMDTTDGIIAHYKLGNTEGSVSDILYIHEDDEGVFWIATDGEGLIKWNRSNAEVEFFNKSNGLSHNRIYAVYEDQYNQLWMPSGYGLMQYGKETEELYVWTQKDGLPFDEFISHFHFQSTDGKIYLGGANGGLVSFNPFKLLPSNKKLIISDYMSFDAIHGIYQSIVFENNGNPELLVQPNEKSNLLKISNTEYTNPKNTIYKYRFVDTNSPKEKYSEWIFQEDNQIRLVGLEYGKHQLEIEATSSNDLKTKGSLSLIVNVLKPYYLQTWFLVLLFLVLSGAIYFLFKWRTYQLEKDKSTLESEVRKRTITIEEQKDALENANNTKDQLMAIIGHDLRGPLFSLQGLEEQINYLLETNQVNRLKELGSNMENTSKFLTETLNSLLNWSSTQMGTFPYNPVAVNLKKTIEEITLLFEGNADAKGIRIAIDASDKHFIFVDKDGINIILRNLISNAIKFTKENGSVNLSTKQLKESICITIRDSGIGISKKEIQNFLKGLPLDGKMGTYGEKSIGLGLVLVSDLVKQNKGTLSVHSAEGIGTTFELTWPIILGKET